MTNGNTTTAGEVEMARRICARVIEGDSDNPLRVMKANRYYEGALDDDHHMAIALAAIIETTELIEDFVSDFGPTAEPVEIAAAIHLGEHLKGPKP